MRPKLKLVQTCGACPEQYDVYLDGKEIGYMRLRHGSFRAEYKGETVYRGSPHGDGMFEDDDERKFFLSAASNAIIDKHLAVKPPDDLPYEMGEAPNQDDD